MAWIDMGFHVPRTWQPWPPSVSRCRTVNSRKDSVSLTAWTVNLDLVGGLAVLGGKVRVTMEEEKFETLSSLCILFRVARDESG